MRKLLVILLLFFPVHGAWGKTRIQCDVNVVQKDGDLQDKDKYQKEWFLDIDDMLKSIDPIHTAPTPKKVWIDDIKTFNKREISIKGTFRFDLHPEYPGPDKEIKTDIKINRITGLLSGTESWITFPHVKNCRKNICNHFNFFNGSCKKVSSKNKF